MNDSVTQESLRSYLASLVCETDFVNRLGPVKASLIFLSLAVLPPEGQQRWHNTLQNQWREVFAALPASHLPPFSLAAYATAMRAGKIRSLEEQVVASLTPACRERLKVLGTGPDEGPAYRETILTMCLTSLLHHWRIAGETRLGLERFDRLPDLLALAQAGSVPDRYAEQERLAREYDAQKKPYRLSMPQRHPGRPCSSGAHTPPVIQYTLVNPARNERTELWEADVHEAREHGAELPAAVAAWLANLNNAEPGASVSEGVLEQQMKNADWSAQGTAAALGKRAGPTLARFAADSNADVRELALACLDIVGGTIAQTTALDRLTDRDPGVVSVAIQILHHYPPDGAADRLLQVFDNSRDAFARRQIPLIVGRLGAGSKPAEWVRRWNRGARDEVNEGLLIGLARMGHAPAREEFVTRMHAARGDESREWIDYATYMDDPWVVPALGVMLERLDEAYAISPDQNPRRLRTADLAAVAIAKLSGHRFSFPVKPGEQLTRAQLDEVKAYVKSSRP